MNMKKVNRFVKKQRRFTPVQIIIAVIFGIYALLLLYPYVYAILISLASPTKGGYDKTSLFPLPQKWDFTNYFSAWSLLDDITPLPMLFLNSVWYSVGLTVIGLFNATVTAYVCAKYRFPGRRFIYAFALVMMMVPIIGGASSNLAFNNFVHGYNNYTYIIWNAQTIGGSFVIIYACFRGVDWSYAESSFIDGAGHFRTFFKVMLPQIISPLIALALTDFIACWSDAETALVYFPDLLTLGSGLYKATGLFNHTPEYPVLMATMVMCLVPSVTLFAVFQNKLMDIQMGGALKG